jgi:hypothetical protein
VQSSTKLLITRSVLLCAAIITAVVAAYTTIHLFQSPDRDLSLSPEDLPQKSPVENETNKSGVNFDIEGKFPDEFETETEPKNYENEIIPPYQENSPITSSHLTARAIYDFLPSTQKTKLILIILLEIIAITIFYKSLMKRFT